MQKNNPLGVFEIYWKLLLAVLVLVVYNILTGRLPFSLLYFHLPLLLYYFYFLVFVRRGINPEPRSTGTDSGLSCTVIIPFRNEAASLPANIAALQAQQFPAERMEVIYVNDHSTDASGVLVSAAGYKVVSLPDGEQGKKAAIAAGIAEARHPIIVCSDADCTYPQYWLASMMQEFDGKTGFVSGPVAYANADASFFVKLLSLEYRGLILTGASLINYGIPTIANGANAAYRKALFLSTGGFSGSVTASGDDEYVMHNIMNKTGYGVRFCMNANAVVATNAPETVGQFFSQRSRWASKSPRYNAGILINILIPSFLFFISDILLWILVFVSPGMGLLLLRLCTSGLKALGEYLVLKRGVTVLAGSIPFLIHILTSVLHSFYIVFSTLSGVFKPFSWKGRTTV